MLVFRGVVYGLFSWNMFWDARFIVGYVGEFPFRFRRLFGLVEEFLSRNLCVEPAFPLAQDSARRAPLAHESLVTQFFPGKVKSGWFLSFFL